MPFLLFAFHNLILENLLKKCVLLHECSDVQEVTFLYLYKYLINILILILSENNTKT